MGVTLNNFVPYTTLGVLLFAALAKRELLLETVSYNAQTWGVSDLQLVVGFSVAVVVLMVLAKLCWMAVEQFRKYHKEKAEKQAVLDREKQILLILFHALGGPGWKNKTRWWNAPPLEKGKKTLLKEEPIWRWRGVHVDPQSGRVNKLILAENGLSGRNSPSCMVRDLLCLLALS